MNPPPEQSGNRIVSKGSYVAAMTKKVTIGTAGLSAIIIGLLLFAALCMMTCSIIGKKHRLDQRVVIITVTFCACSGIAGYLGVRLLQNAELIEPGVPLTHANTADLPAPDSLVRASEEPLQKQQAMLLRPAAQYGEAHEEQLLRASLERDTGA